MLLFSFFQKYNTLKAKRKANYQFKIKGLDSEPR